MARQKRKKAKQRPSFFNQSFKTLWVVLAVGIAAVVYSIYSVQKQYNEQSRLSVLRSITFALAFNAGAETKGRPIILDESPIKDVTAASSLKIESADLIHTKLAEVVLDAKRAALSIRYYTNAEEAALVMSKVPLTEDGFIEPDGLHRYLLKQDFFKIPEPLIADYLNGNHQPIFPNMIILCTESDDQTCDPLVQKQRFWKVTEQQFQEFQPTLDDIFFNGMVKIVSTFGFVSVCILGLVCFRPGKTWDEQKIKPEIPKTVAVMDTPAIETSDALSLSKAVPLPPVCVLPKPQPCVVECATNGNSIKPTPDKYKAGRCGIALERRLSEFPSDLKLSDDMREVVRKAEVSFQAGELFYEQETYGAAGRMYEHGIALLTA